MGDAFVFALLLMQVNYFTLHLVLAGSLHKDLGKDPKSWTHVNFHLD